MLFKICLASISGGIDSLTHCEIIYVDAPDYETASDFMDEQADSYGCIEKRMFESYQDEIDPDKPLIRL